MAVVYLLYKVFPPKAVFSIGMSALLFLFGFVISCQMFYLGLSGVWFLLLCLFPHYLIYLGMLYYLAAEARKVGEDKNKKRMAAMILILTFFVGILSESILSKIFLKKFFPVFVYAFLSTCGCVNLHIKMYCNISFVKL